MRGRPSACGVKGLLALPMEMVLGYANVDIAVFAEARFCSPCLVTLTEEKAKRYRKLLDNHVVHWFEIFMCFVAPYQQVRWTSLRLSR